MTAAIPTPTLKALVAALEEEGRIYCSLHRLSLRQERYMRRGDLRRLEWIAGEVADRVPRAQRASARRERILRDLARARGLDRGRLDLDDLAPGGDHPWRERLSEALRTVSEAARRLYRKNYQNHMASRYALDLVEGEKAILAGATAGERYDRTGEPATASGRGVLDGRA